MLFKVMCLQLGFLLFLYCVEDCATQSSFGVFLYDATTTSSLQLEDTQKPGSYWQRIKGWYNKSSRVDISRYEPTTPTQLNEKRIESSENYDGQYLLYGLVVPAVILVIVLVAAMVAHYFKHERGGQHESFLRRFNSYRNSTRNRNNPTNPPLDDAAIGPTAPPPEMNGTRSRTLSQNSNVPPIAVAEIESEPTNTFFRNYGSRSISNSYFQPHVPTQPTVPTTVIQNQSTTVPIQPISPASRPLLSNIRYSINGTPHNEDLPPAYDDPPPSYESLLLRQLSNR